MLNIVLACNLISLLSNEKMRRFLGCLVKDKKTSEQEFYAVA